MNKNVLAMLIVAAVLAGCGEKTETASGTAGGVAILGESAKPNLVSFCVKKDGFCGYFDPAAKQFAIPPQFEKAFGFSKRGLAKVGKDGKAGFINVDGSIAVPIQFSWVHHFNARGVSAACQEPGKCGYIDTTGQWVISPQLKNVYSSDNALVPAQAKQSNKWGYINDKGEWVIPAQFESAEDFAVNGLARVEQNGKYGYIDGKGQMVIPAQFSNAYSFKTNGLAEVKNQEGKIGFIDSKGQWAIPAQFEEAYRFNKNGLAAVKLGGKYGYIDVKGQMVIPPQFAFSIRFDNGLAVARKDEGKEIYGYIDANGQWVIPEQFTEAGEFSSAGLAYVKMNDKCGYVDGKGQLLVPPQFDECDKYDVFERGVAWVRQGDRSGYIDAKGKWIVYRDTVCDTPVAKNADDQVVWPKKPVADICAEAAYARNQADAARQREADQACAHVYVGKEFRAKGGIFNWELIFIVEGVSAATQQVTVRTKGDSYRQEISCFQVPR